MKIYFTRRAPLWLCALFFSGSGLAQEVVYPFNPDANGDNQIYVADLVEVLALYESEYIPESIMVDGITLEEYLMQLNGAISAVSEGADGVGIAAIIDNGDGTLTFELTDGASFITGDLIGPPGSPGADGANGVDGADGADGADGVGIQEVGLSGSGELGVVLTDGTTLNLGCVLDSDGDGICDGEDGCSDLEAANYDSDSNAGCLYNRWFIPYGGAVGAAQLGTEAPFGYREAHFECVQQIVDWDPFCINAAWDGLCQEAYDACVNSDEVLLERFNYGVGDPGPSGGVIVYVDTFDVHLGFDYLEAAAHDFVGSGLLPWSEALEFTLDCAPVIVLQPTEGEAEVAGLNGADGGGSGSVSDGSYRVRHAGGTAIGTGLSNTLELARYSPCTGFVASQVMDFEQNGYRDFFIPSIAELELMGAVLGPLSNEVNQLGNGGGGFFPSGMAGSYWSSSEFDSEEGYGVTILNFDETVVISGTGTFDLANKVRPVRAF
ncbi:DUF1566 domain-containing protein [Flavobacteriales bacterium]|nr:DUF1566 domain-containing protein [Flavobacteriales bacterium]